VITQACVIVLGDVTDSEREDIDSIIREHAIGCWHELTNVWIAGGHSHSFWLETIEPILSGGGSEFLALALPKSGRGFSGYMVDVDQKLRWLHQNYIS
jgi:hypothetical protein